MTKIETMANPGATTSLLHNLQINKQLSYLKKQYHSRYLKWKESATNQFCLLFCSYFCLFYSFQVMFL